MGDVTGISWTDSTFNPWIGCTKVGPGCDNCYAEQEDNRRRWGGATHWGAGVARHRTSAAYWKKPLTWSPRRVFCASLADVFDNEAPEEWRADLWRLIGQTPQLTWQLVTKRIGNVSKMLPPDWGDGWANVWIIATVVNQDEMDRDWPKLREVPACVRGVSIEPMLGPIAFPDSARGNLHWAIYGGESLQRGQARECHVEWVDAGIYLCRHFRIAPFVKQLGHYAVAAGEPVFGHGKKADMSEWPDHLRVREFPVCKKHGERN